VIRSFTLLNLKSNDCFSERTVKIQSGDLKSRIDACQKDSASLKDRFNSRLNLDTNIQVKEIKVGLQQTGAFFYLFVDTFFLIYSR
jgi:hypothetical protein